MTVLTMFINRSGLVIALAFVLSILVTSFFSRWLRSTELRFEGFEFADEASRERLAGNLPAAGKNPGAAPAGPWSRCAEKERGPEAGVSSQSEHALDLRRSPAGRPQRFLSGPADAALTWRRRSR